MLQNRKRDELLRGLHLLKLQSSDLDQAATPEQRRALVKTTKKTWRTAALELHPDRAGEQHEEDFKRASTSWEHLQAWAEDPLPYRPPQPAPRAQQSARPWRGWRNWAHQQARPWTQPRPPKPPPPPREPPVPRVLDPIGSELDVLELRFGDTLVRKTLVANVSRAGDGGTAYTISFCPELPDDIDFGRVKLKLRRRQLRPGAAREFTIQGRAIEQAWGRRGLSSASFRP